jgi:hypothetical protein
MKTTKPERRVVNIPSAEFNIIKKYCQENALNMPKWLTKLAIDFIIKESKYTK